jgi:hypothetical protein
VLQDLLVLGQVGEDGGELGHLEGLLSEHPAGRDVGVLGSMLHFCNFQRKNGVFS